LRLPPRPSCSLSPAGVAQTYPAAILLVALLPTHRAWCARETIIATFTAASRPRSDFEGAPFVNGAGHVFGTVSGVGGKDTGAIYQITPHRHVTYLRNFMNTIERDPQSGVIGDSNGNLYGTTQPERSCWRLTAPSPRPRLA
jgi:hypothetical protein